MDSQSVRRNSVLWLSEDSCGTNIVKLQCIYVNLELYNLFTKLLIAGFELAPQSALLYVGKHVLDVIS